MRNLLLFLIVLSFLSVVGLSGCAKSELVEDFTEGVLEVDLSWEDGYRPSDALLWVTTYHGKLAAAEECNPESYAAVLPLGQYSVCAVNSGIINAECTEHQEIRAMTDETTGTLLNVGNVFCGGDDEIWITSSKKVANVGLHLRNAVRTIRFTAGTEMPDERIDYMELQLTGIVRSVKMINGKDTGERTGTASAIMFGDRNPGKTAVMSVFGWRGTNVLTAILNLADGRVMTSGPQEITDFLQNSNEHQFKTTLTFPDFTKVILEIAYWDKKTDNIN